MITYAFCVVKLEDSGVMRFGDGTLSTDKDLSLPENYDALKADIGRAMNPPLKGNELIMISLTVIGQKNTYRAVERLLRNYYQKQEER